MQGMMHPSGRGRSSLCIGLPGLLPHEGRSVLNHLNVSLRFEALKTSLARTIQSFRCVHFSLRGTLGWATANVAEHAPALAESLPTATVRGWTSTLGCFSEGEMLYLCPGRERQLERRIGLDLIVLNALTFILVVSVFFIPNDVVRLAIGLPAVLFFPGYALVAALYPRRESIDGIHRTVLSLGMSLAVVPLVGLVLNYTPWGITLVSISYCIPSLIFALSVVAWVRRMGLPAEERFYIAFRLRLPELGENRLDKALAVVLALSVVAAVSVAGYVITQPKMEERFTEFYILGVEGMAADYASEAIVGETVEVTVGIINRQHETTSYRLILMFNDVEIDDRGPIVLEHGDEWEQTVDFKATRVGNNQELELLLYRDVAPEPYLGPLRLWIDVME